MKKIIVLCIILFCVICYLFFNHRKKKNIEKMVKGNSLNVIKNRLQESQNLKHTIPFTDKIIWSYWHDKDYPFEVVMAINTWVKNNPEYLIYVLNNENVGEYLDLSSLPSSFNSQKECHKADIIRIALLEKYGGVWLDSTLYLYQPLYIEWESDGVKNYDVGGFYADIFTTNKEKGKNFKPVFENWFISAPKNSKLIQEWKKEFYRGLSFKNKQDYIDELEKTVDLQNIFISKTYLMMHCSFLKVINDNVYNIKAKKAMSDNGPLSYLIGMGVLYLLTSKDNPFKVLKLRGGERTVLKYTWLFNRKDSIIDKLINM